MSDASVPPGDGASLGEILSARARRTPASRLTIDVLGGLAVGATALWARPRGVLLLVTAGLCLAMYGVWAAAERRLYHSPWTLPERTERFWRATRGTAALVGVASFLGFLFGVLALGLGQWSS